VTFGHMAGREVRLLVVAASCAGAFGEAVARGQPFSGRAFDNASSGVDEQPKRKGVLHVTTEPPGAAVSLGVWGVSSAPATFRDIAAGRHKVTITLKDYRPVTLMVDVVPRATTSTNVGLKTIRDWLQAEKATRVSVWREEERVGEFSTIREALQAASPGSRVELEPGYYRENVVLERPVALLGKGPREHVLVETDRGPCLRVDTERAVVRGLTFRRLPGAGRSDPAVDIVRGNVFLDDSTVISESLAAVVVRGTNAEPRIRSCAIYATRAAGLVFQQGSKGEVVDTEVLNTALAAVEILEGSDPTLRRCRFHDGQQVGVLVHRGGKGRVLECDIAFHRYAGVEIRDGGDPTLRRCKVYEGNGGGIVVHSGGRGEIADCDIYGNARAGIEIRDGGDPVVRNCHIRDGHQSGILVHRGGKGTVEDCELAFNLFAGIEIRDGGNPAMRGCTVHRGFAGGLYVHRGGKGTFAHCKFLYNALAGVEIRGNGRPVIRECAVGHGREAGILVHADGAGRVEACEVFRNASHGLEIRDGGTPVVTRSRFRENGYYGLLAREAAGGTIRDCVFRGNGWGSVEVVEGSRVRLVGVTE